MSLQRIVSEKSGIWGLVDFNSQSDTVWLSRSVSVLTAGQSVIPASNCVFGGAATSCGVVPPGIAPPHLSIAADARLHNRKELTEKLGLKENTGSPYSDSCLLLAAYEKWREDCSRFLLGEFAFAIWDSRQRRLFCCRDHIGFRPFLYWRSGSRFVFASDSRTILAIPGVERRLNQQKFAGTIRCGGYCLCEEDTFHDGIMALPARSSLTADSSGIRRQTYWNVEIQPNLVPRRPEEASEALRELLFEAVECRLGDGVSVAAELSGGLDSSAVTSVASRCLERRGQSLLALSAVLPEQTRGQFTDERAFIDEFRSWPNIRIEYLAAAGRGPFDSIEDPGTFVPTPVRTSRFYLYEALEERAVSSRTQVILQGNLGEMGPTCWAERYFTELATTLRWLTLSRELRQLRKVEGVSPLRFLAARFRDLVKPLVRRGFDPFVLLTADFSRNRKILGRLKCASPDQRTHQAAQIRQFVMMNALETGQTIHGSVRVSQPLLDKRLLEFCLAAPPAMKVHDGYRRYLIRKSLDGVLPEKIQWRTGKVPFSPDYFARYNAQLGKAREFVAAIGPKDPVRSVIDVTRLSGLLKPADKKDIVSVKTAREVVPATIYAICFLRQFSEYRP